MLLKLYLLRGATRQSYPVTLLLGLWVTTATD